MRTAGTHRSLARKVLSLMHLYDIVSSFQSCGGLAKRRRDEPPHPSVIPCWQLSLNPCPCYRLQRVHAIRWPHSLAPCRRRSPLPYAPPIPAGTTGFLTAHLAYNTHCYLRAGRYGRVLVVRVCESEFSGRSTHTVARSVGRSFLVVVATKLSLDHLAQKNARRHILRPDVEDL